MKIISFCLFFILCGCEKYYLEVKKEKISRNSLASTFVGSPDPRQENPPCGQKLYLEWRLPWEDLKDPLFLILDVVFRNYSQQRFLFPINHKRGIESVSFLGDDYREKGGLLTYRAEIARMNGSVIKTWEQSLWVEVIDFNPEDSSQFYDSGTNEPIEGESP